MDFKSNIKYEDLHNLDDQKKLISNNIRAFVTNNICEHTLLWGAKGCGKSTLVKLAVKNVSDEKSNLKLIEIFNLNLDLIADLCFSLSKYDYKFILFIDDLNFLKIDENFKYFKSLIEGSILSTFENIKFFVTSNLRNLSVNIADDSLNDLEKREIRENTMSLVDRFGCKISFYEFDKKKYLELVRFYLKKFSIEETKETEKLALGWSIQKEAFLEEQQFNSLKVIFWMNFRIDISVDYRIFAFSNFKVKLGLYVRFLFYQPVQCFPPCSLFHLVQ